MAKNEAVSILHLNPAVPLPDDEVRLSPHTEETLATRFGDLHASDLRYVALWSKWLRWTGKQWQLDDTLHVFDKSRAICRDAAANCGDSRLEAKLASAQTVAAVERLARADRRLAATADQWDPDPWLLNTPDGVIDLRTGELRPHNPADYLTRTTAVGLAIDCFCWSAFLHRVTGGDLPLQQYLQRLGGYALTGVTREHAFAFLYGTGANGKSVFLDTLAGVLGDYHRIAPIEMFVQSTSDRHPTELAGLRGARLVTSNETAEGRRWAESRIKALTGGDRIAARFMRQDFFEFTPEFKLIIAGNHKPSLRSVDEAIRRRIHLVPFTVTIPPEERDPQLRDKLKVEWPGVLKWMVEGCLSWQREALQPPAAVTAATMAYLQAEDTISAWLDECCESHPSAWSLSNALFASWTEWAGRSGEHGGSLKRFAQMLEARGFSSLRRRVGRGYSGLRIKNLGAPTWS